MKNVVISIIVPIYKVEKQLDRCIQSLLNQTYPNIEIILVDDGSPDNCPALCDEYAALYEQVTVIHKINGGLSDARNCGLTAATGKYVLYVDSDDYIELDACERLLQYASDEIDFVVGVCKEIRQHKEKYQKHTNIIIGRVYTAKEFAIKSIKSNEWFAPAWLNMYKRQFLLDNELFYKKGILYEDTQMLPRLYLAANKIVYSDCCFYNYIIREDSIMTSCNSPEKISMSLSIYKDWFELLNTVEDKEYRKYLYGALVRYYMANARSRNIVGWKIEGLKFKFAIQNAIGIKDKFKVILFTLFPKLYIRI